MAEVLSFEEANRRFEGRWLALEVVREDESGMPEQVRLLAEGASCAEVSQRTRGRDDVLILLAGPPILCPHTGGDSEGGHFDDRRHANPQGDRARWPVGRRAACAVWRSSREAGRTVTFAVVLA